jgi:hypothetical protein
MTSSVTIVLGLIEIFVTYKILVLYACSCENFELLLACFMSVLMFPYSM